MEKILQNSEFIQEFIDEARTHIESIETGLLRIDAIDDKETINLIFRAIHSIKGTAGFFGLEKIVELSHAMENVFGGFRNGKLKRGEEMVDILLMSNDCLRQMVEDIEKSESIDISNYVSNLNALLDFRDNVLQESQNNALPESRDNALQESVNNALPESRGSEETVQNGLITASNNEEIYHAENEKGKKSTNITVEDSIRVNVNLLNNLMNLASEMVLGRNQLLRTIDKYRKSVPGIEPILQNIDRITTELQERIMQTRMQPIGNIFNKFPRIARELAHKLGKEIDLKLQGVEVELDKSIIEALGDPLTHLVRNSAGHGIEFPEERKKSGKPRAGTIILKAYHEGGYVNIEVIDDGKGIDTVLVLQKAIEKGIIDKKEADSMTEQDILSLIFEAGFSTSNKVDDFSGRGVGTDVVKTNIERLGGTVEVHTKAGEGTTFRFLLPLTLAIVPSLIVEAGGEKFALPQVNLQEIVRIKKDDTARKIEYVHNSKVLRLRGELLSIVDLDEVLGLKPGDICSNLNLPVKNPAINQNIIRILVLKIGSKHFGIAVDAIHTSEEILVKPIPSYLKECKCYSGVTIMGDGKVAMILDAEGIVEKARLKFAENTGNSEKNVEQDEGSSISKEQNLLIFKCSGTETLGINISMIARIEEIDCRNLEKIGEREYIKYRGAPLRIIRPEDYLPISRVDGLKGKGYVIILKNINYPIGILADKIYDNIKANLVFSKGDIKSKGILSSVILANKITLLIDGHELLKMADPENNDISPAYGKVVSG